MSSRKKNIELDFSGFPPRTVTEFTTLVCLRCIFDIFTGRSGKRKAGRQKAEGRRQKAEGRRQKAEGYVSDCFRFQVSGLRFQGSGFRSQVSRFRLQVCDQLFSRPPEFSLEET
jgi:hypothetical protein